MTIQLATMPEETEQRNGIERERGRRGEREVGKIYDIPPCINIPYIVVWQSNIQLSDFSFVSFE